MKMNTVTEVIDQYVRESSVRPDKESRIINIGEITHIFTLGTDDALYLTKENEAGETSKFTRYQLIGQVSSFAAEKINETTIAVAVITGGEVYAAYTRDASELTPAAFTKMDFSGALGGMELTPYRVLLTSLGMEVSLFIEFHDASGFTQQFMVRLAATAPVNAMYFRLPSEFTEVLGSGAGRAARQFVDGVYTYGIFYAKNDSPYAGYVSDAPQLIYTPCRNPFGSTPPSPIRLKTQGGVEALCTLVRPDRKAPGTHLFTVGEGRLSYYPFQTQFDWLQEPQKGTPLIIAESSLLLNARQLAAYILADRLYIFIRTADGNLHYTVADYEDGEAMADHFLEPVHLMSDVVSFDVHEGRLSIFTKEEFIECTQNPVTGAFSMDRVRVGTELDTHSSFSAYSTRIFVGEPGAEVIIESANGEKLGFYSEGYYYKTRKAILKADSTGYAAIIQRADGISPDCFTASFEEEVLEINPALEMQKTLLSMNQEDDFKNAVITDPFGNTSPLAGQSSQSGLGAAAAGMASLYNSAIGLIPGMNNPVTNFANGVIMTITDKVISFLPACLTDNPFTRFAARVVNDITAAFKWVIGKVKEVYKKTVGKVVNLVIQKTQKAWKFLAEIGGKVISVVVDCVAKIAETIKNVLELIGIPVDKILRFFKKALGLERASRINKAIKQIASTSIDMLVEKASEMKETTVDILSEAIDSIAKWADLSKDQLEGNLLTGPLTGRQSNMLSTFGVSLSGHNMYALDLIKRAVTPSILTPPVTISESLRRTVETLFHDIADIGQELGKIPSHFALVIQQLESLLHDFTFDNLISAMKKILGLIAADFLSISRALIKTVFDIVIEGIKTLWLAINTPVEIPFLSGVLRIFGVDKFALIDIVTYPTAFLAGAISAAVRLFSGKELIDIDDLEEFSRTFHANGLMNMGGGIYA